MNKIILENINEGNGYYKVNLAYLNKEQVEEIESLVSKWNLTDEDFIHCIGMCLTDASERRFKDYGTNLRDCLAWLEKQGEQKPVYKVEPKFEVDNWIVYNRNGHSREILQIYDIRDGRYYFNDNVHFSWSVKECDEKSHLWTISDAKVGDVLQLGKVTAIFQEYIGNGNCKCYCSVCDGEFEVPSQDGDDNSYGCHNATPVTKEQYDTLMKAMADAGYTFDFENKELKEIEFNPDDLIEENYQQQADDLIDMVTEKPAWSKEDEHTLQGVIDEIQANKNQAPDYDLETYDKLLSWLKSLKNRVAPQKLWKPSEEQMQALKEACDKHWEPDGLDPLYTLYEQLKKL